LETKIYKQFAHVTEASVCGSVYVIYPFTKRIRVSYLEEEEEEEEI
jgi:hypothetical protein